MLEKLLLKLNKKESLNILLIRFLPIMQIILAKNEFFIYQNKEILIRQNANIGRHFLH